MKGHIRERSSGHWAVVLDVRDPESGRRRRKWHSFSGTKREAQVECARLISEITGGTHIDPIRLTIAAFLDQWLDERTARAASHPEGGRSILRSAHNVAVAPNWRCCWAKEGCVL